MTNMETILCTFDFQNLRNFHQNLPYFSAACEVAYGQGPMQLSKNHYTGC